MDFNCALSTEGKDGNMSKPSGADLLELLVTLLAQQENVNIKYRIEEGSTNEK